MNADEAADVVELIGHWWENWQPAAETRALWASAFADLPFDLVAAEINRIGATSTEAWPPRPGVIRAAVASAAGLMPPDPDVVWPAVWAASRMVVRGGHEMTPAQPLWGDPILDGMYDDVRVWRALCFADHEPSARAAFTARYRAVSESARRDVLAGDLGVQLGAVGELEGPA